MKSLRLNDKTVDCSIEDTDTMSSIVSQIATLSSERGEYPVKLIIDSKEYPLAGREWRAVVLADIDTVNIYTFSPIALREYLPQLSMVPQLLQEDKRKEAMELVFKLSILMSYTIAILPFLDKLNSEELQSQVKMLTEDLNRLQQSMSQDDVVLIGDLLEYEIRDKLEQLLDTIGV